VPQGESMNDSELTDNHYDAEQPQEIAAEQPQETDELSNGYDAADQAPGTQSA